MVKVTFFQNQDSALIGFTCSGHADFAETQDIVCAGVSALVINCINSIDTLTPDTFFCDRKGAGASIEFRLADGYGDKSQLLLHSLVLGLEEMEEEYGEHLDIIFEEVSER